ncbi:hypothetical protein L7F22_018909 [Adiantum nelumboides]|nr:hypothetical protein [Adiantum nelumboides]
MSKMYSSRHRPALSLAASVDLDVEGGGRLDEDYDGGWSSSSSLAWSAKGPAAYTSSMSILQSAKLHLQWAKAGWFDANRWIEAGKVATRSAEIRFGIIKGLVLSATITTLIFFLELAFFPKHLFPTKSGQSYEDLDDHVGSIGNVFWLYPLIAGSYFLAASWTVDVAHAAYKLKHARGISMVPSTIPAGTSRRFILESYRVILILNYFVISVALQHIPWIGRTLSFIFMSFIDAYYCFEQGWIARGWSVERRMRYAESRWAYFVAFGLPSTAISFFHPSGLLNLMLFMLVFPICTVLAMLGNPQPRQAPNSTTTITPTSSGVTSSGIPGNSSLSPVLPPRLPIFWLTVKCYRLVLRSFPRLLDASSAAMSTPSATGGNSAAWRQARQFANPALFAAGGGSNTYSAQSNGAYGTYGGVNTNGIHTPQAAYGSAGGFGTGVDLGTGVSTTGKRGAMAAQIVDGAWGGQGINGGANAVPAWGAKSGADSLNSPSGYGNGNPAVTQSANANTWAINNADTATKPAPPPSVPPPPRGGKKKD